MNKAVLLRTPGRGVGSGPAAVLLTLSATTHADF